MKTPSKNLMAWKAKGKYLRVGFQNWNIFVQDFGNTDALAMDTLLILHGFPESSYSFHAVIPGLQKYFKRIVLFDFIGFGWSDKPETNFSYSLMEQTDIALGVWDQLGVDGGHLVAHDMGNSVATELAARHVQGLLPKSLNEKILSYTLTNGSIFLKLARLRITQKLLLSRWGSKLKWIVSYTLFKHQIRSAHGNKGLHENEIQSLWEGCFLQDGHLKNHLTIKYIKDRRRFEQSRWLPALTQLKVPVHFCWGADDAVARIQIPEFVKAHYCPQAKLSVMPNVGHFCQLDAPELWVETLLGFYKNERF